MVDLQNLLAHDIIFILLQKIIDIVYLSCRRVLNGKNRIICHSFLDGFHTASPAVHMKDVDILSKIFQRRLMLVGPLHTLIDHPAVLPVNPVDLRKRKVSGYPFLHQKLILQFPAYGHDLPEQFLHAMSVKIVVCKRPQSVQLLQLPSPVQHLFSIGNLIFRHLSADVHPLFK